MKYKITDGIRINRNAGVGRHPFADVFEGFNNVSAVKRIFGRGTASALANLRIKIPKNARWGYMWVDDKRGVLVVSMSYLRKGDASHLYLDVIHELVHIKQHMEGRELFDEKYEYVDRPTEIAAYKAAAREARRIGMSRGEIVKYLEIEGWISGARLKRLCKNIGL